MSAPLVEAFVAWLWPKGLSDEELLQHRAYAERIFALASDDHMPPPKDVELAVSNAEAQGMTFQELVMFRRVADEYLAFREERMPRPSRLSLEMPVAAAHSSTTRAALPVAPGQVAGVVPAVAPGPVVDPPAATTPSEEPSRPGFPAWAIAVGGAFVLLGALVTIAWIRARREAVIQTPSVRAEEKPVAAPSQAPLSSTKWVAGPVLYVPIDAASFASLQQAMGEKGYGQATGSDLVPKLKIDTALDNEGMLAAARAYTREGDVPADMTYMLMTPRRFLDLATEEAKVEAVIVVGEGTSTTKRAEFDALAQKAPRRSEPPMRIMRSTRR